MIKLDVEEYCHKCSHFEANVKEPELIDDFYGEQLFVGDFVIECEHEEICRDLIKNIREDETNGF